MTWQLSKIKDDFGYGVDILVNNAGVSQRDDFMNMDYNMIMSLVNTNFVSNIMVWKAVLPFMMFNSADKYAVTTWNKGE